MASRQRAWNVGNLLVLALCLGLGLTFVMPHVTASRVARIEGQAEEMTARLLAAGVALQPLRIDGQAAGERLLAALANPTDAARLSLLEPRDADIAAGIYLEGKHHHFLVTLAPQTDPEAPASVEVYAWPSSSLGPTSTAFFFPQDGPAMYTHNLRARYAGLERAPQRGSGRAQSQAETYGDGSYIGADNERWLRLPPRAAAPR